MIIVALDFDNRQAADDVVEKLGDACHFYKVGLELLTAAGPDLIRELVRAGKEVFLDLKLFEIPTSVASAVRAAGALGVTMVTVHATGGTTIMKAAVDAAKDYPGLKIAALTVVTSLTDTDLAQVGIRSSVESQVVRLAQLAENAGCPAIVASPQEIHLLRTVIKRETLIVTPGITLSAATEHARSATPAEAIRAGADYIVMGRSITRANDPVAAIQAAARIEP
jgi:orotidine-5'-phosphate decarboxylase